MWLYSGGVDKDFDVGMYNVEGLKGSIVNRWVVSYIDYVV